MRPVLPASPFLIAVTAALLLTACAGNSPSAVPPPRGGGAVSALQAQQVRRGMSQDQLKALLGEPERITTFPTQTGVTWTYLVRSGGDRMWIDVDITPAGMVRAVTERKEDGPSY